MLIEPSAQQSTQELADALGPLGNELRAPTDFLKGVVDEGSKAADAVDHSVALLTAAAHGGLADPATINVEIDTVLRALSYFDHEHRYEDEIELARTLANLLALLERWWELVQTLLHAFEGAKHLATSGAKDQAQGWVLHELGSLSTWLPLGLAMRSTSPSDGVAYQLLPRATVTASPLTPEALSLHRKTITSATSRGVSTRPGGYEAARSAHT